MSARDEILARVRSATADITTEPQLIARPASSSEPSHVVGAETLDLLAENVADYRATVLRVPEAEVGAAVVEALRAVGASSVVLPSGLPPQWQEPISAAFEALGDTEASSAQVLDSVDAVVTGAALGIAMTGTIVLDHQGDQGRRELTLVPDVHVCVIRDDQVVHDVPEAVSRLRTPAGQQRPLTWISGPSATSDIELQRVEGVHGPRTLIVVMASGSPGTS